MTKKFYQVEVFTGGAVGVQRTNELSKAWELYEHTKAMRYEVKLYRMEDGKRHELASSTNGVETLSPEMKGLLAD